jgi:hypothetical protein
MLPERNNSVSFEFLGRKSVSFRAEAALCVRV